MGSGSGSGENGASEAGMFGHRPRPDRTPPGQHQEFGASSLPKRRCHSQQAGASGTKHTISLTGKTKGLGHGLGSINQPAALSWAGHRIGTMPLRRDTVYTAVVINALCRRSILPQPAFILRRYGQGTRCSSFLDRLHFIYNHSCSLTSVNTTLSGTCFPT